MQWVKDAITRHTGVTDAVELETILDIMSDSVRTFGGLSPERLKEEALIAKSVADYLKTEAGAAHVAALENEWSEA